MQVTHLTTLQSCLWTYCCRCLKICAVRAEFKECREGAHAGRKEEAVHEMAVGRNWADGYRGWSTVGTERLEVEEREQAQVQAQVTLQAWVRYAPEDGSGFRNE